MILNMFSEVTATEVIAGVVTVVGLYYGLRMAIQKVVSDINAKLAVIEQQVENIVMRNAEADARLVTTEEKNNVRYTLLEKRVHEHDTLIAVMAERIKSMDEKTSLLVQNDKEIITKLDKVLLK